MLIKGADGKEEIKCDSCGHTWSPKVGPEGTMAADALKCPKCSSLTSLTPSA